MQQGIYDAYELSCALEPHLLRMLLDRGASAVVFTDTDTCFYAPVDDLARPRRSSRGWRYSPRRRVR